MSEGREDAGYKPGRLKALADAIKQEFGDNPDFVKQALADFNALERQAVQNHFEASLETSPRAAAISAARGV